MTVKTHMNFAAEKGPHREHDGARAKFDAALGNASQHSIAFEQ